MKGLKENWEYIAGVIVGVLFVIAIVCAVILITENRNLEKELNNEKFGVDSLVECPMCGEDVDFRSTRTSYYIECCPWRTQGEYGCGLKTGYYDTKEELVKAWNGMGGSE